MDVIPCYTSHKFAFFNGDPEKYPGMLLGKMVDGACAYGGMVQINVRDAKVVFSDGVNLRYYEPEAKLPNKHQLLIGFEDQSCIIVSVRMYGAIAAVGPVLKAKDSEMSVALATIFVLNAIALFIFPVLGHWLGLDQQQFGTWAAIAIHDTSSVVGAGAAYGEEALKVATTIKLTRALWIIPLALATSFIFKGSGKKISVPWFIFYFIGAIILNTYVLDGIPQLGQAISDLARKGLIITMFFIGASLSMDVLKQVGMKPLIQGVILWVVISLSTLAYILLF